MFDVGEFEVKNSQPDLNNKDWDDRIADTKDALNSHVTKKPFQKKHYLAKEAPAKPSFNNPKLVAFRAANLKTFLAHFNLKSTKDLEKVKKLLGNAEIMKCFEDAYLADLFSAESYIAIGNVEKALDRILAILFQGTKLPRLDNPEATKKLASLFIKLLSTTPRAKLNMEVLIRLCMDAIEKEA